jgi:hypothetical protein
LLNSCRARVEILFDLKHTHDRDFVSAGDQ